ncbi:MAG: hypothetical protein ACLSV6_05165 [Butyricicoccus sp.]
MRIYEYGEQNAKNVLLQPVGDHDLPAIENEIREIKRLTAQPFRLIAVKVESWNNDLSPWCAPAVFGHEDFGDGAAALLREILPLCGTKTIHHRRILNGRAVCPVERISDRPFFRHRGSLAVSVVSEISGVHAGA